MTSGGECEQRGQWGSVAGGVSVAGGGPDIRWAPRVGATGATGRTGPTDPTGPTGPTGPTA